VSEKTAVFQARIADRLNILRSSVSAAVLSGNRKMRISDETIRRVLEAAEQLSDRPNRDAAVMPKGKTGMIGIGHGGGRLQSVHERQIHDRTAVAPRSRRIARRPPFSNVERSCHMSTILPGEDESVPFRIRPAAFTLIELLVAIAIISVLFVILLPALGTMRNNAESTQCLANLRSIGSAMGAYVADNNGYYPLDGYGEGFAYSYQMLLSPYLGSSAAAWQAAHNGTPSLKTVGVWACPAEKDFTKPYYCYALNMDLNLGLNAKNTGESWQDATARFPGIKAVNVAFPASYALICDSFQKNIIYTNLKTNLNNTHLDRRHGGHPNILYADGHVASFRGGLYGYLDGSPQEFYLKMWRWNAQLP